MRVQLLNLQQQQQEGDNLMNKAISAIVLIVTGLVISYLMSNILISIVVCSILGLLLNREIFSSINEEPINQGILPSEYHQRFQDFKEFLNVYDYYNELYEDTVLDSLFIDSKGILWCLGVESLDWYQNEGDIWVKNEPQNRMILVSESELR